MSKDLVATLIRTVLGAVGAFFFGKVIAGTQVTSEVWSGWIGGLVALITTVWGIWDKSSTLEGIQSGIRSFITVAGGILLSLGKINGQNLEAVLGLIGPIVAFIYSWTSKAKTKAIAAGTMSIALKKNGQQTVKTVGV